MNEFSYKDRQRLTILGAVFVLFYVSGGIRHIAAEEAPEAPAEQHEAGSTDPAILKQQALEKARLHLKEIKGIYSEEKERLRNELKNQLAGIRKDENTQDARRLAVQEWKKNDQNLKAAYQTVYAECQQTIAELSGAPKASSRRRSSAPIQILIGPASKSCPRRSVRRRCRRR